MWNTVKANYGREKTVDVLGLPVLHDLVSSKESTAVVNLVSTTKPVVEAILVIDPFLPNQKPRPVFPQFDW